MGKKGDTPFVSKVPDIFPKFVINLNDNVPKVTLVSEVTKTSESRKNDGTLSKFSHSVSWDSMKQTAFVGLKNLGATCYMNSLLQTLFFTNKLRKAVLQMSTEKDDSSKNVALALQRVFQGLQLSDKPVETIGLIQSFEPEPLLKEFTDPLRQCDAQEFGIRFLEVLSKAFSKTSSKNLISSLFEGSYTTTLNFSNNISNKTERFYEVLLAVKDSKDVYESLKRYTSEEVFSAGGKQTATKFSIFNTFPPVLHLHLQRLQYDSVVGASVKINDRYEFSEKLKLDRFLQKQESTPANYTLHSVVAHSGEANSGHYVCFVDPKCNGSWFKFDDAIVSRCSKDDAIQSNFGGEGCSFSAYLLTFILDSSRDDVLQNVEFEVFERPITRQSKLQPPLSGILSPPPANFNNKSLTNSPKLEKIKRKIGRPFKTGPTQQEISETCDLFCLFPGCPTPRPCQHYKDLRVHIINKHFKGGKSLSGIDFDLYIQRVPKKVVSLPSQEVAEKMFSSFREKFEALKKTPWQTVNPTEIFHQLKDLQAQLPTLISMQKKHHCFFEINSDLEGYIKSNVLIVELKSDALKERHWRALTKQLQVNWVLSELTLGQVWDIDLQKNELAVKDIIRMAQGEMALEKFLKQVHNFWETYMLDFVVYQKKCSIVRGWNDLFSKLNEHISSISAMKCSPHFKMFEEDALSWEKKLSQGKAIFEVWMDVQRRWVYLEGIFSGSSDIQTLLPVEAMRSRNKISLNFQTLMKKVKKNPIISNVIFNVQVSLESLSNLLDKIQKALGKYLEEKRSSFPRFYFVGDEDLLEIIGNSKDIPCLQKHFKKMFAGVASIILSEQDPSALAAAAPGVAPSLTPPYVLGLRSKEGEEVRFVNQISIANNPEINNWFLQFEQEMRFTLAKLLTEAVADSMVFRSGAIDGPDFLNWLDKYQAQIVVLAAQISWSEQMEGALAQASSSSNSADPTAPLTAVLQSVESTLQILADSVLQKQSSLRRKKLENLITEFVHKRDVTRRLIESGVTSPESFEWLSQMRFYFDPKQTDALQRLTIHMANAKFFYGFEYLGVQEKLVQTPLTDRCYLTMTQALEGRLGGSPFGPAGTGKTESVKALGNQLGRFVLVFNCDETFDFQAMGRILVGLCQVGAWGCFDEFNRLEERMLSAISQQIQQIQKTLKNAAGTAKAELTVKLFDKSFKINSDMAIFITMNPGYAGRSNLPDNLKSLFRSLAMSEPDRKLIAQVMLFSQGFRTAEKLATKIVPFFKLCDEQLSKQSHYDFGLRALKSVLVSAGNLKRDRIKAIQEDHHRTLTAEEEAAAVNEALIAEQLPEQEILIQSVCETMVPKLIAEDIPLLFSLLSDVFPGIKYTRAEMRRLKEKIANVCQDMYLVCDYEEGGEESNLEKCSWLDKVFQLYQILQLNHGLMMVGPSGSGKSTAWKVLLRALEPFDGMEGVPHVINPKAISKEALYGRLDPNTREWTDGLFTHILRKIIDNVRGEQKQRHWIIFDGDVDPEWVENLNSVLDDNKLLTLPNGERLSIPPNVRIMFEVQDLKFATLATVSRCGMIWFSEDVLTTKMICNNFFKCLRKIPLEDGKETVKIQNNFAQVLEKFFAANGLVQRALEFAAKQEHIMDFTRLRALSSLFSMLNQCCRNVLLYNAKHPNFTTSEDYKRYVPCSLVYCVLWSFAGDAKLKVRQDMGEFIRSITTIPLPPPTSGYSLIDYEVNLAGEWTLWKVKPTEVETDVASPKVFVPTVDTVRYEALLNTWLAEHKPLVLCGPPGSGKTMMLLKSLCSLPNMEVVGLNFSSATTPELLLKTFDHCCEYRKTPDGLVLSPLQAGKRLILFCDEINLPAMDKYATIRVISFLRQLLENGGFYRTTDHSWVRLERIQFVGACNPPTDPGRNPLSQRFLRHVPIIYVDYPGETSLKQIYGTLNQAMLKDVPDLEDYAEPLTAAMVEFYLLSQERFTQDIQPHYVYSPRELTRWVRGIHEAIRPLDALPVEGLVRLWAHEALRLFQDRLVTDNERAWTDEQIDLIAVKHFPNVDCQSALERPILYSSWLSENYAPVEREHLRNYIQVRLNIFYQEKLDAPLVLFDEVLDHVLRIDRIFKQPQGHLLLIGISGTGKTTLCRFVAWMNRFSVCQIRAHNKYTAADFDEDLRSVLRRSGCENKKVIFMLDESNVLDNGFLERMNTLLANGEVPGLFKGDEYTTLITQIKEASRKERLRLRSTDELYKWFTGQVIKNLHVVFTMNPSSEGLEERTATSPALFNRCVLNWLGDWTNEARYQVACELTSQLDQSTPPVVFPAACTNTLPANRKDIINSFVYIHQTLHSANERLLRRGGRQTTITPRHYLDFINYYVKLYAEKRSELEDEQLHLNVGLTKIRETVEQVEELQKSLASKSVELEAKKQEANAKLKEMLKDQQDAEKEKENQIELKKTLKEQLVFLQEKTKEFEDKLKVSKLELEEVRIMVASLTPKDLHTIKRARDPSERAKKAIFSVCLLIKKEQTNWPEALKVINNPDFINTLVTFDADSLEKEIIILKKMKSKYIDDPEYTVERMLKVSSEYSSLVRWARGQYDYAHKALLLDPLKKELLNLQSKKELNEQEVEKSNETLKKLLFSCEIFNTEHLLLQAKVNETKLELASVQSKVDRSIALLASLSSEKERWEDSLKTFKSQMQTAAGDCLLSAAFLAYAGYFDQQYRQSLFNSWSTHLKAARIPFRADLVLTEYLSTADERFRWQANTLPSDDLCTENAIMLKRFNRGNRVPLLIDPSGQGEQYLLNEYEQKRITKTSFLDDSFRKNLESALRFGIPLLVQDAENYDPILNPVLNNEVRKTEGCEFITLGDQEIDLSPSFRIFLSTRNPEVNFSPELCSRVTFVNFTITQSSLQAQCLNQVLKSERPDIEEKRTDLLKLQNQFIAQLRNLEKSLLQALSMAKGSLLDDDSIIIKLKELKLEADKILKKAEETDNMIAEVKTVSDLYLPLAQACSSIYFTLKGLHQVHFLYQYSLQFFLDIFTDVLAEEKNTAVAGGTITVSDYESRLAVIARKLFEVVYVRVTCGMLHHDWLVFALLLCKIYVRRFKSEKHFENEFDHLMRGREGILPSEQSKIKIAGLKKDQLEAARALTKLQAFRELKTAIENPETGFKSWLDSKRPESRESQLQLWTNPGDGEEALTDVGKKIKELLVIHAFRPDRFTSMAGRFIEVVFDEQFQKTEYVLKDAVKKLKKANTPILVCSVPGYDASGHVDKLAYKLERPLTSVTIGSAEGYEEANKAINKAAVSGEWVLLKNAHLSPKWLLELEKVLHIFSPNSNFRLFLTLEIHPKIPANLLRAGRIVLFESPSGVCANLRRSLESIPKERMNKAPSERSRLYFLLSWFHAIVQERLRYAPLGWSKKYEFNESDLKVAFDTLDTLVDKVAAGQTNLPLEEVPFDAIQTLLGQCIYGGKIDNDFDQRLLNSFLQKLFTPKSFEAEFTLASEPDSSAEGGKRRLTLPKNISGQKMFLDWAKSLTCSQTASLIGLPSKAERVLLANHGVDLLGKLKMQLLEDDDDVVGGAEKSENDANGRPGWIRLLLVSTTNWLKLLPEKLPTMRRTSENIKEPLYRYFEREVNIAARHLALIRTDLTDVIAICGGKKKQTNYHRKITECLAKGMIPGHWRSVYKCPDSITVITWITDFAARLEQMARISASPTAALKTLTICLGGLFNPEAYITATRQFVAQANGWSLEELQLQIIVKGVSDTNSFAVSGLTLQGAKVKDNQVLISSETYTRLPTSCFRWICISSEDQPVAIKKVTLPVYLNSDRSKLLLSVELKLAEGQTENAFYERSVAFIVSSDIA